MANLLYFKIAEDQAFPAPPEQDRAKIALELRQAASGARQGWLEAVDTLYAHPATWAVLGADNGLVEALEAVGIRLRSGVQFPVGWINAAIERDTSGKWRGYGRILLRIAIQPGLPDAEIAP